MLKRDFVYHCSDRQNERIYWIEKNTGMLYCDIYLQNGKQTFWGCADIIQGGSPIYPDKKLPTDTWSREQEMKHEI